MNAEHPKHTLYLRMIRISKASGWNEEDERIAFPFDSYARKNVFISSILSMGGNGIGK